MNANNLVQKEKAAIALIYILIISLVFDFISGGLFNFLFVDNNDAKICFLTGALLLLLGSYIVEPYFTKPSDAIVNSLAALLALLGLGDSNKFLYFGYVLTFSITVLLMGILTILFKDTKFGRVLYYVVELLGKSKVIFSVIYIVSIYSYYGTKDSLVDFLLLTMLWVIIVYVRIIEFVYLRIKSIVKITKKKNSIFGKAIGCDNPLHYTFEHENSKGILPFSSLVTINNGKGELYVGLVVHSKPKMSSTIVDTYLITNEGEALELSSDDITEKSIFCEDFAVKKIDINEFSEEMKKKIIDSPIYKKSADFIGFVMSGSDINKIKIALVRDDVDFSEGMILETVINSRNTLYQLINGITEEETFDQNNNHGFQIGIARKLGVYDKEVFELNISRWVPMMYEPVFLMSSGIATNEELADIAETSIGRLPNTKYRIPIKDVHSLVTHNIAILGILGIGKSCLSFELIKKIVDNEIKVICIDITNQYADTTSGLPKYIDPSKIICELTDESLKILRTTKNNSGTDSEFNAWGNVKEYKEELDSSIESFIEGDKKVLILNPDWHPVTQAATKFKITEHVDLTITEKTRVISERVFIKLRSKGESNIARVLFVYEEAHSLVPEWNSVANEGDKTATNGTAKVILQGRKYGLGCMVITQRTANISKSILNQCNTIFALRIFDDTGKNFLENYIGSDYSSTLPTLEERHVIAIGKGLKLKQPVIVQLNDKRHFIDE